MKRGTTEVYQEGAEGKKQINTNIQNDSKEKTADAPKVEEKLSYYLKIKLLTSVQKGLKTNLTVAYY